MRVKKRNGQIVDFRPSKIEAAINKAFESAGSADSSQRGFAYHKSWSKVDDYAQKNGIDVIDVERIQDIVEQTLMSLKCYDVAKAFILYREKHNQIRSWVDKKLNFIESFKQASNAANSTVDDNSNVGCKNIGVLNSEIHKQDNILVSRAMVERKLKELFPDFDSKQYVRDLQSHICYKHDESSFSGAIAPYCCSITMYPFLTGGIKGIGGLSAAPKNLDSFCGMYINLIFATSAMFAGAVATSEFLLYFDYFARKEWGDNYWQKPEIEVTTSHVKRSKSIISQIHQYWQQVIYSINQPAAARGLQSAFVNFSYFDKPFFEGMFGDFYFPDGTKPQWSSLNWLQKEFMQWFNAERLRCMLTFPVESFALVYKDGKFDDEENAKFVAEEYARGHSFFTYISDTVDSLSSCCFTADTKVLWKSSAKGVQLTTLKELNDLKWETDKKNLRIFHNSCWVKGKSVKLPNRSMYKITTQHNKQFVVSDNHINVTFDGEKRTSELTTNDYLMFNTHPLQSVRENDEHLTYNEGVLVGLYIGDGTLGNYLCQDGTTHELMLSLNEKKWNKVKDIIKPLGDFHLLEEKNNVWPVRVCSKHITDLVTKWTGCQPLQTKSQTKNLNLDCLLQSYEFRKGILDGWYFSDGGNKNRCYTTSKELVEKMEVLCTSLGLQTVIDVSDRTNEKVVIRGEEWNRNFPLYCLRWYDHTNARQRPECGYKWKNNSIYWKIESIEKVEYADDIYCIERNDQDEPYFTLPCGLITHNCRLKNMVQTKEFSFTNGNMGVQTGSKSVITLNLNRIVQNFYKENTLLSNSWDAFKNNFKPYMANILGRIYKYHEAYNELLWDMYDAGLLPVYKAGFINLNKQYLTIGLNGLNQAAEFLGLKCTDNADYQEFCQYMFSLIKEQNALHNTKKLTFNTEQVPAESLAIKNYNWDKEDGYWVPGDVNLYASYVFKPSDDLSVLERIRLHGKNYIGDYLDGGAAAHINLDEHLSVEQYEKILKYAAENGCQYLTFNVPNSECDKCGYITKHPIDVCPKCGSTHISLYDRVIGYLTKIKNWSDGRQIEQRQRVYSKNVEV